MRNCPIHSIRPLGKGSTIRQRRWNCATSMKIIWACGTAFVSCRLRLCRKIVMYGGYVQWSSVEEAACAWVYQQPGVLSPPDAAPLRILGAHFIPVQLNSENLVSFRRCVGIAKDIQSLQKGSVLVNTCPAQSGRRQTPCRVLSNEIIGRPTVGWSLRKESAWSRSFSHPEDLEAFEWLFHGLISCKGGEPSPLFICGLSLANLPGKRRPSCSSGQRKGLEPIRQRSDHRCCFSTW